MSDNALILFGIFPLAAYVTGSTPFGVIIARSRGFDLRKAGSGNVGATNVGRVVGRKWGMLCFALDVLKGFGPVLLVGLYLGVPARGALSEYRQAAWLAVGFGAIAGHVFSFWLRFRGGKGVATSLGVLLGFYPYFTWAAVAALASWIIVVLLWRYVSLGSIVAAAAFPPLFVALNYRRWTRLWPLLAFAIVMAGLVIVRHRSNIARLLGGTENRIGRRSGEDGGGG